MVVLFFHKKEVLVLTTHKAGFYMNINAILETITHNGIPLLAGIVGIGFLIGFHELGHFLFCKLFNIRTPSFSIGFGPKIFSRQIGDTLFSLSAIPLGGYVEIAGAAEVGQGDQKDAAAMDEQSFAVKPYYQKLLVMLGGIMFNLIFAYCTFIALFSIGMPANTHFFPLNAYPTIGHILPGSAAQKNHLVVGDTIIALNGISIHHDVTQAINGIKQAKANHIIVTVERADELFDIPVTFNEGDRSLGVTFASKTVPPHSFVNALKKGIQATHLFVYQTFLGFKQLLYGRNIKQMAGPIAIIGMMSKSAGFGFTFFLFLLAIISVNLAVLNVIPLPILDGGQILFYTIEAIIQRPIPIKAKEYIHIACWLFFIALTLYLSTQDILRIANSFLK